MKRALLVIDVQNIYFTGRLPVSYPAGSLDNIVSAMKHADISGIPIIIIQHITDSESGAFCPRGSEESMLHDSIAQLNYDIIIEKSLPGSFTGTGLKTFLEDKKIDTLVISGYMSQMCCDTTARQALHAGYNVEFLSDATGTLDISNSAGSVKAEELHKAVLVTQQMRFSKVLTLKEWIKFMTL